MRKKSHISLARFLVRGMEDDVLSRRWKAFYGESASGLQAIFFDRSP